MDYLELSGATISERDKAFAQEFANFVNGSMSSPDQTGRELTKAHRYLQQQMFKVFLGFMKQLALNYQQGRYDDRQQSGDRQFVGPLDRLIQVTACPGQFVLELPVKCSQVLHHLNLLSDIHMGKFLHGLPDIVAHRLVRNGFFLQIQQFIGGKP